MSIPRKLLTLALLVGLFGGGTLSAQDDKPSAEAGKIDAQGRQRIDSMLSRLRDAKTVSVQVSSEVLRGGEALLPPSTYEMRVKQPNLVAITLVAKKDGDVKAGDESAAANPFSLEGNIVSDGKKLVVTAPSLGRYTEVEAPADFAAMREKLQASQGIAAVGLGSALALPFVMGPESLDKFFEDVTSLEPQGVEEIGQAKYQRYRLEAQDVQIDLFVSEGKTPALGRAEFVFGAGNPGETMVRVNLTDWAVDQPIDDQVFAIAAPEGLELAETLLPRPETPKEGPNPLLGKEAPALKLPLLTSGEFDLAAHKGNVVVLDFWATWCGPCVQAMPIIEKVVDSLAAEGVTLYAVNLQEDAETVKGFLAEKMLNVTVALDSKGELAQKYGVQAIPQTVLIGRDGTVQVVHVGLSGSLEEELRTELKALLESKDLAQEELKKAADEEEKKE